MISLFMIASVLEVGLVVLAAIIFLAIIVAALAVIAWSVAGVFSAAHQNPAAHR